LCPSEGHIVTFIGLAPVAKKEMVRCEEEAARILSSPVEERASAVLVVEADVSILEAENIMAVLIHGLKK
jgi:hypothetical protein